MDPPFFDRLYFLAPLAAEAQRWPYVLFLREVQDAQMDSVRKCVLWGKGNLSLIRPSGNALALALETLFYAEDIRDKTEIEIEELVSETDVSDAELTIASQLIESLTGGFDSGDYENEHRREARAMLKAKLDGEKIARPEPAAPAPVIDLVDVFKQSVEEAQTKPAKKKRKPQKRVAAGSWVAWYCLVSRSFEPRRLSRWTTPQAVH